METTLLFGHFEDLADFCQWCNDLVEDELLKAVIRRIIHFQLLPVVRNGVQGLDACVLVEMESAGE